VKKTETRVNSCCDFQKDLKDHLDQIDSNRRSNEIRWNSREKAGADGTDEPGANGEFYAIFRETGMDSIM
jgi:hypothetical protein